MLAIGVKVAVGGVVSLMLMWKEAMVLEAEKLPVVSATCDCSANVRFSHDCTSRPKSRGGMRKAK